MKGQPLDQGARGRALSFVGCVLRTKYGRIISTEDVLSK